MRPSALVTVAGVRVGLVGVMTYDALSLTLAANVGGLATSPLVGAIVREATALRAAGGARWSSWSRTPAARAARSARRTTSTSCDDSAEIFDVARRLPAGLVNAIVGGHTHDGVAHRVAGIPIVQAFLVGACLQPCRPARRHAPPARSRTRASSRRRTSARGRRPSAATARRAPSPTTRAARYEGRAVAPLGGGDRRRWRRPCGRVDAWRASPLGVSLDRPIARGPGDAGVAARQSVRRCAGRGRDRAPTARSATAPVLAACAPTSPPVRSRWARSTTSFRSTTGSWR